MSVTSISSVMASTANVQKTSEGAYSGVANSDFMTLLLAQLKNQDPMKPMESNDLMGQIAQLNSLKTLESIQASLETLNKSNQLSYAASLVGRAIKAMPDKNNPNYFVTGKVTSTTMLDGIAMLQVDGKDIELSSVVEVSGG